MDSCLLNYIKKGFQLNFVEDLKIKGIYLDKKIKLENILKHLKNDKKIKFYLKIFF